MPKSIAITPSWYWPTGVPRAVGVPPLRLEDLLVRRWARLSPEAPAVIGSSGRLSWTDLASRVAAHPEGIVAGEFAPNGADSPEAIAGLFAALALGTAVRLGGPANGTSAPPAPVSLDDAVVAFGPPGKAVWHSHRSLVSAAVATSTFLQARGGRPWVIAIGLDRWEGLHALTVAMLTGAPVVVVPPERALEAAANENAAYLVCDLEVAHALTREAKREVKSLRGTLAAAVLFTPGPFDADQRRRVGKLFECPALAFFGLPETGPIFASHPSWYLDESIGIPITNAHVVPVEPRSGLPLRTLWELVDHAEVTVWTPALMVRSEEDPDRTRFEGGRLRTGVMASQDANGMVYLLGS